MAVVEKDPGVLTEKLVLTRTRAQDLDSVKKLNCWASGITDISVVRQMANLEVCSLSGNKISSLDDFSHCPNLQELYIRKNNIGNLSDIHWLKKLNRLRVLWLSDNSCSTGDNYRMTVLKTLPNLQKLDNVVVTEDEINRALEEGEELPFPDKFITSDSVSGQCLLEKVEMCDELELTREPCEESVPKILKTDITETESNKFEQRFKQNDNCLSKQSEISSEIKDSGNIPETSNLTNISKQMPETSNETPESSQNISPTDMQKTSSIPGYSEETGNPEVTDSSRNPVILPKVIDPSRNPVIQSAVIESSRNPVIQSEVIESSRNPVIQSEIQSSASSERQVIQSGVKESTSTERQVIQSERSSAPILIFEKGHKMDSSKDAIRMNPDRPREPPNDLAQSENSSTNIKIQSKEEIQNQNHRKIPPVALSFEQSNKLREELGLKPLPVDNISTMKSLQSGITKAKNANILQASLLLVKDLDKDSLEIVKDVIQTRLDSL